VDRLVRLANPLSREQSVMRTSMLPGILANARKNQNFSAADFALFEIGKIYFARPPRKKKARGGRGRRNP
jgi:phenylalanyl-tRNA synthetase beta chain